jgi:hypothetical protein
MKPPGRWTTVFPRQGHYALDRGNTAAYPPADITIERIGQLIDVDFNALCGISKLQGATS